MDEIEKIKKYFKGDVLKTLLWFTTSNPLLGNISPLDMIKLGRINKLNKFIDSALNENFP